MTDEKRRLEEAKAKLIPWKKWGPYLSERQWGTVREDYSADGNAWDYFTHDQARSRAYRWGEDGMAGISDDHQILCFAVAMWNGKDPILKERMFGLTNSEGNHGEDVKEYYFYLDSTPTHSYMKYLYKYPQAAYPYADLVKTNRERGRSKPEYELLDTGVFDDDRYFDVFVEYAKSGAENIEIKISVANRGPETATLHVLPTLWFRNTWMWSEAGSKPVLKGQKKDGYGVITAHHTDPIFQESLADYGLYCEGDAPLLFTENESNNKKLFGTENASPYVKDAFHTFVIEGKTEAVNPAMEGTKAAPHYVLNVGAGKTEVVRLHLGRAVADMEAQPFEHFDEVFVQRKKEADEFYDSVTPGAVKADPDRAMVMRQAFAGMLWSKQYFYYDLTVWLREHKVGPWSTPEMRDKVRNGEWYHMYNNDIISMPDKWEYPWYAAWDLAFHMLAFQTVDSDFAKAQLELILSNDYLHPNGQIPAYEWNFGDTNPPVHAYATMQIYMTDKERNNGKGDLDFLTYAFSKLLVNFTWWLNRKDRSGNNLFEGGFLGLDNIGVFDRSSVLPGGGYLEQADGTAWMVFFSQQMLRIAVELALHMPIFEEFVIKFFEHTMWIAGAMDRMGTGQDMMWDDVDGYFYDVLRMPDGKSFQMKVRSMVGLLPLTAVAIFEDDLEKLPRFRKHAREFLMRHPELAANLHMPATQGLAGRRMLSTVNEEKLRRILTKMLDENEFFGPHGIRALSRYHIEHPFVFDLGGQESRVSYVPGDSDSGMFGGNSNWRGPVWMPVNFLLVTSLMRLGAYYGDTFKIECPTGSGKEMNLFEVGKALGERLIGTFVKDSSGRRPVYGTAEKFQTDPHWRDNILFFEYFHGDTGAGVGASHQTGWTGCIARIIQANGALDEKLLAERDIERIAVMVGQGQPAEEAIAKSAKERQKAKN